MNSIENKIREYISGPANSHRADEITAAFVERFREIYGDNLRGVIYYGSKLVEGLAKSSSFRDFFIIVDNYGPMSKGWFDRLTLPLMPPNMWFEPINLNGVRHDSKYHLLTLKEFTRYCSSRAPDHYAIGRMSKRVAIVWTDCEDTREVLTESLREAFFNNARRAVPLLDSPRGFEEAVKHFLAMSYRSELRLETPEKIEQLYRALEKYIKPLYEMLFEMFVKEGVMVERDGLYAAAPAETRKYRRARMYVVKSKARHIMRFPFMIGNMDNWMDQLLGKYERTYGKPLELTDFEKRFKLLTAVKYLYKIKIAGKPH